MLKRALKAAVLNGSAYEGVRDEPQPLIGAMAVVGVTAIAYALAVRNQPLGGEVAPGLVASLAVSTTLVGWGLWSATAWYFGSRLFGGDATYRALLRGIGTAYGPGILLVLISLPNVGVSIEIVARLWMLVAVTTAIKHTQGHGWFRAVIASVFGWTLSQWVLPGFLLPVGEVAGDGAPAAAEQSLHIAGHHLLHLLDALPL